jgi:hypothetical protein
MQEMVLLQRKNQYTEWPQKMYTHCTLILMSKECIHFFGATLYFLFLRVKRMRKALEIIKTLKYIDSFNFHLSAMLLSLVPILCIYCVAVFIHHHSCVTWRQMNNSVD